MSDHKVGLGSQLTGQITHDPAVSAHADYSWEAPSPSAGQSGLEAMGRGGSKKDKAAKKAAKKAVKGGVEPEAADAKEEAVPFSLCVFSL